MARRPMQIPEDLWARIKRKAEREGRTMTEVLRDLIGQLPDFDEITTPQERNCILCGRPSGLRWICEDCYYDPEVVRPQICGVIYYQWIMQNKQVDPQFLAPIDEFAKTFTRDIADYYGLTDAEWEVWQEWLMWRKRFRKGEVTKDDPEWRKFCKKTVTSEMVGIRAGGAVASAIFGKIQRRP